MGVSESVRKWNDLPPGHKMWRASDHDAAQVLANAN